MPEYSVELPGGIKVLNPVPTDNRDRVNDLNSIVNDPTYFIGYSPILDKSTGKVYIVESGNASSGWTFKQIYTNLPPSGGDANFKFAQSPAASSWYIVHNLGKNPSVSIINDVNDNVIGAVNYVDYNTLIINFNDPVEGVAYLN